MFFSNIGGTSTDDTLYKELGLEKSASQADIKKAYKKLALKYHPDRNKAPEAEEKFKKISKAYDILNDEEKRSSYDRFGLDAVNNSSGGMPGFGASGNPFDIFEDIFGGGGVGGIPRGRTQFTRKRQGRSIVKEIEVDLNDIYNETNLKMSLNGMRKCSACNGLGAESADAFITCPKCDGSGVFVRMQQLGPGMISQSTQQCMECGGKGKKIDPSKVCKVCNGTRTERKKTKLELKLNKNHKDGDKIVFSGMADYDPDATSQGDLIILLKQKTHSEFKRIGDDLVYVKTISLLEALCGMDLTIEHLDKRTLFVKTSQVIQPDSIYKISGEGMSTGSNLYVKFKVVLPNKLSEERKKYLKKLIQTTPNEADTPHSSEDVNKQIKFLDELSERELELITQQINFLNVKGQTNGSSASPEFDLGGDEDGVPGCNQQ